ncbi:uncharacterized protein LOC134345382 isoform X2 [Mobula hypostoma]|uniref:uncharacterized protein LOC134345382 isoform X2 n=1 Tax=Mobula hypostoma TaxID=723540 RepID=UPI002FC3892D
MMFLVTLCRTLPRCLHAFYRWISRWLCSWIRRWIPAGHCLFNRLSWFRKSIGYQRTKGKHFVGLKNQGATCYLNTLLQTWFMTQEVKECITNCKEQDSLICELRCLFKRLSDGNERSLSTEQLTSQLNLNVYEQRDIEECFRSLVNKLNSKMDQDHNILKIYQVTMVNSLKCLNCTQSMDEDTFFLDIPLSVCSADAAEKFESMEKGLEQFLKEEKMEGDNKCYCNICDMKTETTSRYYFKHLPQILTFQLKRFEFNYNHMAFEKITDCITFPPVLEFTRSQDVRNEWCRKLTVNRENNAPSNDCSRALEERQSSFSFLGVQKGTSVDYEGKHPEAVKDQSEEVSKDEEVKNVDVVKGKETLAQPQEEKQEDSEDITGGNPETPQDHSQQVSTGQKVKNVDVVKVEETPAQPQEVKQDHSEDITDGNPETTQDHSQQVSTGQKLNNVDVAKHEETQEVKLDYSVDITRGNLETPQDQSQLVSTGQEVKNVDVVKDEETPAQAPEVKQDHSEDITGGNHETTQDHSLQVSTGQEVNNVDVVEDEETPAQAQEVKQDHSEDTTGGNQSHSQQDSTGQEVNNVDVVKVEETPAQAQEVKQDHSVDTTGGNPETPQDQSQQVSTGQEVNNVDVVKVEETPAQGKEVKQDHSVDITGGNPETPQNQSQQGSTGQELSNVDVVKGEKTPAQPQEVKQDHSVDITGRNPETPQDHSQQVSTGEEVNNVDVVKDEETPAQAQEVKQDHSEDITDGNPETPQGHSQQGSTGQEEKRYELFAIWHHIGSYGNGHYYAEIKSDSGDWYNFNDEDVKKEMNMSLSSKTAYMLMYRLIDTNYKTGVFPFIPVVNMTSRDLTSAGKFHQVTSKRPLHHSHKKVTRSP